MFGIPLNVIIIGIVGLVIAGQGAAIHHYRSAYLVEEKAHDADLAMGQALADQQKAHNIEITAARNQLAEQKDREHATLVGKLNTDLAAVNDRLRNAAKAMAGGGVSRAGFTAQVCDDKAGNDRLREILQRTQRDLGEAIAGYQRAIGERIVSPAGKDSASLTVLQDWAQKQTTVR